MTTTLYDVSMKQRMLVLALLGLSCSVADAAPAKVSLELLTTVQPQSLGLIPQAVSADGRRMALLVTDKPGSQLRSLILRDMQTGQDLWRVPATGEYWGNTLMFSPDGRTLLRLGKDASAYDTATGQERWVKTQADVQGQNQVTYGRAIFSPDGKRVYLTALISWTQPQLLALDVDTGEVAWQGFDTASKAVTSARPDPMGGFYSQIGALAVSADGKTLATGSFGGGIVLRQTADGSIDRVLTDAPISKRPTQAALTGKTAHGGHVLGLAFTPDGSLISGANDGTVKRWDMESGKQVGLALLPGGVQGFELLPDGKNLLVTSGKEVVQLSIPDLQVVRRFRGHLAQITGLTLAGNQFWTTSNDGTTKRWSLNSDTEQETYGQVRVAAVSPDGKTFALNLGDSTIRLTDAAGHTLRVLRDFGTWDYRGARSLAFSPDGKTLAGGAISNTYMTVESYTSQSTGYLWDVKTGKLLRKLPDFPGESLSFSPDGRQLLGVSTQDGSVAGYALRRVDGGAVVAVQCSPVTPDRSKVVGPTCPFTRVHGASWVANRAKILTMQADKTQPLALVQDAISKKTLSLGKLTENGPAMGISPDGRRIISLAQDGLRVWNSGGKLLYTRPDIRDPQPYWSGPLLFTPDGRLFTYATTLNASDTKLLTVHDTLTGQVVGTLNEPARALGFVQQGQVLATLSRDRGVQLWRIRADK